MDRPLRICFASYRGNMRCGGQGIYLWFLARELARLGHRVDVLVGPPYPDPMPFAESGARLDDPQFWARWFLRDRAGMSQPCGFDQHPVEPSTALSQVVEHPQQVASNRAAQASVVNLKNGFIDPHHECLINTNFTEFVDNNCDALAVLGPQDIVEKRGLARAEKAGENGDRYGTHVSTLQAVLWGFIIISPKRQATSPF